MYAGFYLNMRDNRSSSATTAAPGDWSLINDIVIFLVGASG